MKKIYFSILFIAILGLNSCTKDFIEKEPMIGQMGANFYKTENDAYLSLVAVYDALSVQNWNFVPTTADIRSDDSFNGGDASGNDMPQWQQQEKWIIDSENATVSALWNRCYSGLYRANLLLDKIPLIDWKSDATKKRTIAETKFLRAYFYWDLARHYGWAPILTTVITDNATLASLPQATPAELYTQIAKDLLAAIPDLPVSVPAAEAGRITRGAAQALVARIYLYYDGFVKSTLGVTTAWTDGTTTIDKAYAKTALEGVISSGVYKLLPNYADVFSWTNQNNQEDVFAFQYNATSGVTDWGAGWGINGNYSCTWLAPRDPKGDSNVNPGWSFNIPSFSLAAEFESGDPRFQVSLYDANANLTGYTRGFQNTGYFNNKFMAKAPFIAAKGDPSHNWGLNYADIRYSDVLLMAAELNLSDNIGKALSYYNQVRTRALGASAAKTSLTIDDIFHERRVEFAGEGHRYWDLLRRGLDYAEKMINASFQNIPTKANVNAADFSTRNFKKTTYGMFPIPGSEVRLTSGNLKQNIPAYSGL